MEEKDMFDATCSDCGASCKVPFKPTQGKPVRCSDCFKKNRPQRSFGGRDGNRGGNRGGFGGNRRFDNRNSRPREMHKTKCADCGKNCEVPFKPTGEKPVYCRDCFNK